MTLQTVYDGLIGAAEKSYTSQEVALGTKTFALDVDNGVVQSDYTVQIVSTADPDCWMYGVVTAKSSPNVTISVFKISDITGTFDEWDIQTVSGPFAGPPASQTLGFSTNSASAPTIGDVLSWTTDTGKTFYDNSTVYVSSVVDRTLCFFATVVSYNSGTGAIKLVVNRVSGSGTQALWAISLIDVTASFRTPRGNSNYTIKASDKVVALTAALTANRDWTLPAASSVPAGGEIVLMDAVGGVTDGGFWIFVVPNGFDTINGIGASTAIRLPYSIVPFVSDGVSGWTTPTPLMGYFEGDVSIIGALGVVGTASIDGDMNVTGELYTEGQVLVSDAGFTVYDNADNSKFLRLQCSGITTGTTRTLTVPNASTTIVGTDVAQTLSNKTVDLGSNTVTGTKSQFNTALSDDDFATLGTEQTFSQPNTFSSTVRANRVRSDLDYGIGSATPVLLGTSSTGVTTSAQNSVTFSHTVAAGDNRLLVVGVSIRRTADSETVSSVTYNGVALTLLTTATRASVGPRAELWYMLSPPVGTANVVVTLAASATDRMVCGASTYGNVKQTAPFGTPTTGATASATHSVTVASATNELVIDVIARNNNAGNTAITEDASQTKQWETVSTLGGDTQTQRVRGGSSYKAGASSVTMQWTSTVSLSYAMIGVSLQQAAYTVIDDNRHFRLRSYAKASLPSATITGQMIFVTDDAGGSTPAFSDGTNWRRVADRAVIS